MIFKCDNCGDLGPYKKESNGKNLCYDCFYSEEDIPQEDIDTKRLNLIKVIIKESRKESKTDGEIEIRLKESGSSLEDIKLAFKELKDALQKGDEQ